MKGADRTATRGRPLDLATRMLWHRRRGDISGRRQTPPAVLAAPCRSGQIRMKSRRSRDFKHFRDLLRVVTTFAYWFGAAARAPRFW